VGNHLDKPPSHNPEARETSSLVSPLENIAQVLKTCPSGIAGSNSLLLAQKPGEKRAGFAPPTHTHAKSKSFESPAGGAFFNYEKIFMINTII